MSKIHIGSQVRIKPSKRELFNGRTIEHNLTLLPDLLFDGYLTVDALYDDIYCARLSNGYYYPLTTLKIKKENKTMQHFKVGDIVRIKKEYLDSFDSSTTIDNVTLFTFMRDTRELEVTEVRDNNHVVLSNKYIYPCKILTYAEQDRVKTLDVSINTSRLTAEEFKHLKELIDKANTPESKVWKPKHGEAYFAINSQGNIIPCRCRNDALMEQSFVIGNCFKTEEATKKAVERLKIRIELQRYADEHNDGKINWANYAQDKFCICFDYDGKREIQYLWVNICRDAFQIYFTSKEIAQAAVKAVGEDRIKKYLFEVEQ